MYIRAWYSPKSNCNNCTTATFCFFLKPIITLLMDSA